MLKTERELLLEFCKRLNAAADRASYGPLEALRLAWQTMDDIRHLMDWRGGRPSWQQPIHDEWEFVQECQALCREAASVINRLITPPKR